MITISPSHKSAFDGDIPVYRRKGVVIGALAVLALAIIGGTVEQRRAALRAKWRSSGKATLAQIQAVAESWESQRVETSFLAGVIGIDIINLRQGTVAEIREAVEKIKPAHLPLEITERQYVETPILVGALARQGDSMILWEVDCRNDP